MKNNNFGFAFICCLIIVRRVHIWSSGCSLSNAFDLISGSKFREDIYPNTLKSKWVTPFTVGESVLLHTRMRIMHVIYGVVIVIEILKGPMKMTDLK